MLSRCWIGCCGWKEAQSRYVQNFPVVELQTPFYEPPTPALANKWRMQAPPDFQFCMKAWQLISHTPSSPTYRRLKSKLSPAEHDLFGSFRPTEQVWLAWERSREIARILHAGVVLFQSPASFVPSRENLQNFGTFFDRIEHEDFKLAWEPRGPWPPALVQELCAQHGLVHCVDPFENEPVYGDILYWRLHGRGGYSYRYTEEDFDELERKLFLHGDRVPGPNYLLFNNVRMKEDAQRFQLRLARSTQFNPASLG